MGEVSRKLMEWLRSPRDPEPVNAKPERNVPFGKVTRWDARGNHAPDGGRVRRRLGSVVMWDHRSRETWRRALSSVVDHKTLQTLDAVNFL